MSPYLFRGGGGGGGGGGGHKNTAFVYGLDHVVVSA